MAMDDANIPVYRKGNAFQVRSSTEREKRRGSMRSRRSTCYGHAPESATQTTRREREEFQQQIRIVAALS
jgi:hypothetical protein